MHPDNHNPATIMETISKLAKDEKQVTAQSVQEELQRLQARIRQLESENAMLESDNNRMVVALRQVSFYMDKVKESVEASQPKVIY